MCCNKDSSQFPSSAAELAFILQSSTVTLTTLTNFGVMFGLSNIYIYIYKLFINIHLMRSLANTLCLVLVFGVVRLDNTIILVCFFSIALRCCRNYDSPVTVWMWNAGNCVSTGTLMVRRSKRTLHVSTGVRCRTRGLT